MGFVNILSDNAQGVKKRVGFRNHAIIERYFMVLWIFRKLNLVAY